MPTLKPLIATLGLLASLSIGLANAAPQGAPDDQQGGGQQHGGKAPQQNQQPQKQGGQQQPAAQQKQSAGKPASNQKSSAQGHGQPPQDFKTVHQQFQQRREQIGRGAALPANVRIVKGQPLPNGYGKRLDSRALNGLPQYQGYEWRRVGSDVVLVTVATGIVYTILSGVLN